MCKQFFQNGIIKQKEMVLLLKKMRQKSEWPNIIKVQTLFQTKDFQKAVILGLLNWEKVIMIVHMVDGIFLWCDCWFLVISFVNCWCELIVGSLHSKPKDTQPLSIYYVPKSSACIGVYSINYDQKWRSNFKQFLIIK